MAPSGEGWPVGVKTWAGSWIGTWEVAGDGLREHFLTG